jgi:hypothetical protein
MSDARGYMLGIIDGGTDGVEGCMPRLHLGRIFDEQCVGMHARNN